MARIRSIKPEFWQDHRLAADLTRDQRLLYIGLWNDADDEGRFLAHPRRLLGAIFPYDRDLTESFIEDSLNTLVQTGRLILYTVDGEPYGQLTKFTGHQRINRPSPSRIPSPDSDLAILTEASVKNHGTITEDSPPARKEQGAGSREMEQGYGGGADDGAERADPPPSSSRSRSKRRWRTVPDDWQPNDAHRQRAVDLDLDFDRQLLLFRSHEFDRPKSDPDRTFTAWLERAAEWGHQKPKGGSRNGKQDDDYRPVNGADRKFEVEPPPPPASDRARKIVQDTLASLRNG